MSARGLAIDTAENAGEEFPRFVEYWTPEARRLGADHLRAPRLAERCAPA
jgi:glucan biosynthesis protein